MFIGRTRELDTLNKLYDSDKFEFAVLYGRRRVGKTALISEFIRGKKAIYFMGVESNEKQNLENFSQSIMEFCSGNIMQTSFWSLQAALEYVFELARDEKLILAIDEYPYIARASKSFASTLQMLIDRYKDTSKLMLILCGSSMSFMEYQVLGYRKFSPEDMALIYGIVGGTPQYLLQMDEQISVEENIKNTFLNPSSSIFEEPENLLKQEVREPALYNAIITAVASGASHMAEISTKVGEETSVCTRYLKNLVGLGIVRKETPYGEKESRKSLYVIADNMFRFWYRFIPDNNSIISRGAADLAYQRIAPHLSDYMGKVFEDICMQYLWKRLLAGKSQVLFSDLGRWWGNDPKSRSQTEIDIMGEQDKTTALFGECKWTNENIDVGILDKLVERSQLFHYSKTVLYLFAKKGFTQGCVEKANEIGNVVMVTFEDIMNELHGTK